MGMSPNESIMLEGVGAPRTKYQCSEASGGYRNTAGLCTPPSGRWLHLVSRQRLRCDQSHQLLLF